MLRTAARIAGRTLGWALLVAVVAATVVAPRLVGGLPMTILTGSMAPHLNPGDVAVVAPQTGPYHRGDVITFQPTYGDPRVITHRIVSVTLGPDGAPTRYVTKGDANQAPDDPINPDQVHRRMVYAIPYVGWGLQALNLIQAQTLARIAAGLLAAWAAWALTPTRLQEGAAAVLRRLGPRGRGRRRAASRP